MTVARANMAPPSSVYAPEKARGAGPPGYGVAGRRHAQARSSSFSSQGRGSTWSASATKAQAGQGQSILAASVRPAMSILQALWAVERSPSLSIRPWRRRGRAPLVRGPRAIEAGRPAGYSNPQLSSTVFERNNLGERRLDPPAVTSSRLAIAVYYEELRGVVCHDRGKGRERRPELSLENQPATASS